MLKNSLARIQVGLAILSETISVCYVLASQLTLSLIKCVLFFSILGTVIATAFDSMFAQWRIRKENVHVVL